MAFRTSVAMRVLSNGRCSRAYSALPPNSVRYWCFSPGTSWSGGQKVTTRGTADGISALGCLRLSWNISSVSPSTMGWAAFWRKTSTMSTYPRNFSAGATNVSRKKLMTKPQQTLRWPYGWGVFLTTLHASFFLCERRATASEGCGNMPHKSRLSTVRGLVCLHKP